MHLVCDEFDQLVVVVTFEQAASKLPDVGQFVADGPVAVAELIEKSVA